jgi:putative transposase
VLPVCTSMKQRVCLSLHALQECVLRWIKPLTTSLILGTFADLTRGKAELLAENALLRQKLIILRRQVKRPVYKKTDRLLLVLLARMVRTWKQALFLVQPETLLRWHRELFRLFWMRRSKARSSKPRLSLETISLIKEIAANNWLWGAERIRGELLKLKIRVSKRTIQKYMRQARPNRARGQTWKTFLRNHAKDVWACDVRRFGAYEILPGRG